MSNNYNDDINHDDDLDATADNFHNHGTYNHYHYDIPYDLDDNYKSVNYDLQFHHHHGPGVNDILIHNHDYNDPDHDHYLDGQHNLDNCWHYGAANHTHNDEHSPRDYNHRSDDNDDTHTAQHGGTNRYPGGAWFGCPCAWCAHHQSNP